MKEPLICTPENIQDFNSRLKEEVPEAFGLAKALHQSGLMEGLRGARLGPPEGFHAGVVPVLSAGAEKRLADLKFQSQG